MADLNSCCALPYIPVEPQIRKYLEKTKELQISEDQKCQLPAQSPEQTQQWDHVSEGDCADWQGMGNLSLFQEEEDEYNRFVEEEDRKVKEAEEEAEKLAAETKEAEKKAAEEAKKALEKAEHPLIKTPIGKPDWLDLRTVAWIVANYSGQLPEDEFLRVLRRNFLLGPEP